MITITLQIGSDGTKSFATTTYEKTTNKVFYTLFKDFISASLKVIGYSVGDMVRYVRKRINLKEK